MAHATATYYSGHRLADGSAYRAHGRFCAARQFALGTRLELTSRSGRRLVVTVRDHGPFCDLPQGTFAELAGPRWRKAGRIPITYRVIKRPKRRHRH